MVTIKELQQQGICPQWLAEASTKDAQVEIINDVVTWHDGLWRDGLWKGGVWEDGLWEGGTWRDGTWRGGTWKDGLWRDGFWEGGTWEGGFWRDGTWIGGLWQSGVWKGGVWYDGIWQDGVWKDGLWYDGTWQGGFSSPTRCMYIPLVNGEFIRFGCLEGTVEEWQKIADAGEMEGVSESQFILLKAAFEAAKAYMKVLNESEK